MHDKTHILPIVDKLEMLVKQGKSIEVKIGNFTNLDKDTIIGFLRDLKPEVFTQEALSRIVFTIDEGEIHCYDCEYTGKTDRVFHDHALHLDIMVMCPKCNSMQTKKIGGNELIVNEI